MQHAFNDCFNRKHKLIVYILLPCHIGIVPGIGIMKNQWSNILDVDVHQYGCNQVTGLLLVNSYHSYGVGGQDFLFSISVCTVHKCLCLLRSVSPFQMNHVLSLKFSLTFSDA